MKNQPIIEGWEEDFDKRFFVQVFAPYTNGHPLTLPTNEIGKIFIKDLLQKQANQSYRQGIADAIEEIKKLPMGELFGKMAIQKLKSLNKDSE